jgi:CMP/dCMP kinase
MATVTISREYGSGGDEIAVRVCEMLGYRYFDKALMAQVVAETGLSESEIVDYSEDNYKVHSFFERLLVRRGPREVDRAVSWVEDAGGVRTKEMTILSEAQGIALVQGAIRAVYKQGNVVIVGRGGQAILKGMPDVLHVRIQAPVEARFRYIASSEAVHHFGLQKEIAEHDQAAADYLKHFYDINWADAMLYDLVINTNQLSVGAAVLIIVAAVKCLLAPESSG